jgi:hypothetical protein
VSTRASDGGWSTEAVFAAGSPVCERAEAETVGFSEDLTWVVVRAKPPALSAGAPERTDYYVRLLASGGYRYLVSGGETEFELVGFSRDDSQLVFESANGFLGAKVGVPNVYEVDLGEPEAEQLSVVGLVPAGEGSSCGVSGGVCEAPAGGAVAGAGVGKWGSLPGEHFSKSAVSVNGSRVAFTAYPSERVYVRVGGQETLAVSLGLHPAHYWGMTPDGRYVFYSEGEDLYRFDTESEERDTVAGGAAGLFGVLGVSEDGASAYFAAGGVLTSQANARGEKAVSGGEAANLYEWHQPETGPPVTTFVTTLTNSGSELTSDGADWSDHISGGGTLADFPTSRVAAGGDTVLFASHRSLTGYDNEGVQEYYRYRADPEGTAGSLLCVSCDPNGAPPLGKPLLVGTGSGYTDTGLEYMVSRNLSANGNRVFFDTPDPLVATDNNTGAKPSCLPPSLVSETITGCDLYEWEADGEGTCREESQDGGCLYLISSGTGETSYFLDASATGDDVFFFTRNKLVPEDTSGSIVVYDAHACNPESEQCEEPEILSASPCTGEGCLNTSLTPPATIAPSSLALTGNGNLTPPQQASPSGPDTAEQLAKALKACRKKPARKRHACETAAYKHYHVKPPTKNTPRHTRTPPNTKNLTK